MKFIRQYKYLVIMTVVYICFVLFNWFVLSKMLFFPGKSASEILLGRLYSVATFPAFIMLGFLMRLMIKKVKNKILKITLFVLVLALGILLLWIFSKWLGTSTGIYGSSVTFSIIYGRMVCDEYLRLSDKKRATDDGSQ